MGLPLMGDQVHHLILGCILIQGNISHKYLNGVMLYALQFAKIVCILASRTPPSGLPTKKLMLRYFASLRISLSTLLFEKSNASFLMHCCREEFSPLLDKRWLQTSMLDSST